MSWPTTDGIRTLGGAEADLFRRVAGMMVDQLVAEGREATEHHDYDIALFDQWDWQQQLWLLEQTLLPMLTDKTAPDAAAIFEATIEAVFAEAADLVEIEIAEIEIAETKIAETKLTEIELVDPLSPRPTWRSSVFDVAAAKLTLLDTLPDGDDAQAWRTMLDRLRETMFGPSGYIQAERFRDGDFHVTARFLQSRGLPTDFLAKIPPLRNLDQTQVTIDKLQAVIFR